MVLYEYIHSVKNAGTNYDMANDITRLYGFRSFTRLHQHIDLYIVSYRKAWAYLFSCDEIGNSRNFSIYHSLNLLVDCLFHS